MLLVASYSIESNSHKDQKHNMPEYIDISAYAHLIGMDIKWSACK
jgi:hypothetical protein